ncbi:hypothetical protein Cni_G21565 [Canna indica]|uniref:Uncharacterized protein n=1 Tax=Canna indica TaxID=4628 RepID=A0AAQ3KW10_9LILI|nr:hypothetical protein Cni_G21565 [Canna indica]
MESALLLHRRLLFLPLLLLCFTLLLRRTSAASSLHSNIHLESTGHENRIFLRRPKSKIFHPPTGLCVLRRPMSDSLKLGDCAISDSWQYTPQQFLMVKGTYMCLQAVEAGQPARLVIICESQWVFESGSEKTHLVTKLADGKEVCLDVDSDGVLVSNSCSGFHGEDGVDSQWFEMVTGYAS